MKFEDYYFDSNNSFELIFLFKRKKRERKRRKKLDEVYQFFLSIYLLSRYNFDAV